MGRSPESIEQRREQNREHKRSVRLANPEEYNAKRRKYYAENAEKVCAYNQAQRDKIDWAAWMREYRATKPEIVRAIAAKSRANHKEEIAARNKAWREAHPDYERQRYPLRYLLNPEKWQAAKARRRGAEGHYTHEDIIVQGLAQDGLCATPGCCAELSDGYHIDHIKPISKGGSNWPENIQLLCPPCNLHKGNRGWEEKEVVTVA